MPELPEVETMVRDLAPRVAGRTIATVRAPFPPIVVWPGYAELSSRAVGQEIVGVTRRGKYAGFALASGDTLIIHRGMTGSLLWRKPDDPEEGHVRIAFGLSDGRELRFNDPRKFGKVYLMDLQGGERPLPWAGMGPEPLNGSFSLEGLEASLKGRKGLIKPLLLGQRIVAGLGNIYVDEALFLAGVHPQRRAGTLTTEEVSRLHGAVREVLSAAVDGRGTTFSSYSDIEGRVGGYQVALQVFHRTGEPCPKCQTTITRLVVGGRGTHICPRCQRI